MKIILIWLAILAILIFILFLYIRRRQREEYGVDYEDLAEEDPGIAWVL